MVVMVASSRQSKFVVRRGFSPTLVNALCGIHDSKRVKIRPKDGLMLDTFLFEKGLVIWFAPHATGLPLDDSQMQ